MPNWERYTLISVVLIHIHVLRHWTILCISLILGFHVILNFGLMLFQGWLTQFLLQVLYRPSAVALMPLRIIWCCDLMCFPMIITVLQDRPAHLHLMLKFVTIRNHAYQKLFSFIITRPSLLLSLPSPCICDQHVVKLHIPKLFPFLWYDWYVVKLQPLELLPLIQYDVKLHLPGLGPNA
jgi:hypothetical protein